MEIKYIPDPYCSCKLKSEEKINNIRPSHYDMPITPVEFIERNRLGFSVGCIIKYVCRYRQKNGKEDLLKAREYIDLLLKYEYGKDEEVPD